MKNISFPLLFIIILGAALRLMFFQVAPPALNIDEAALGYNAYSILLTGKDEHGVFLPLSLESFGDWKLPVYSYATILPVSILGLSEFSTRFISIISGIIGILLIYFIAQKLFSKRAISLFAAFFFTVSPWSIYFSRAAYEVNLATTIFLGGLACLLFGLEKKKKTLLICAASLLFGLTLLTYHSYIIFSPLFFLSIIFLFKNKLKKIDYVFLTIPFFLMLLLSGTLTLHQATDKLTTTSIFTNKDILYSRVENFSNDITGQNQFLEVIHTKYLGLPYHFLQNYLNVFSPKFLFDYGGEKLVHNIDGFGNLYIFDALLLFFGFLGLAYFREKSIKVLLIWLLLAPISSAFTIDSPNSTRLFMLMPLFTLISAYGAYSIYIYLKIHRYGKLICIVVCVLYVLNVIFFLNLYFIHNPIHRSQFWRYGMEKIVEVSNRNSKKQIVMRGPENFPYIYFLFYNKYDPNLFHKSVQYYPYTSEGFKHVKSFGRYKFVPALQEVIEKPGVIYIDDQNFHVDDKIIHLPNGDPVFKYYEKKND